MRSEIATAKSFTGCWHSARFVVSPESRIGIAESARKGWRGVQSFPSRLVTFCDYHVMTRLPRFLSPMLAGFAVTLLQVVMAGVFFSPQRAPIRRYSPLGFHRNYYVYKQF